MATGLLPNEKLLAQHWLYEWIDEQGVKTPGNFIKALRKRGSIDRLHELSSSVLSDPTNDLKRAPNAILAGRRLDLSGYLSCNHYDCMVPIVNNILMRGWHYFDTIVVNEDPIERCLYDGRDEDNLLQQAKLLLYLRHIGADKHVLFTNKVEGLCEQHFREYATEHKLGLEAVLNRKFEKQLVAKLVDEATFDVYEVNDGWLYEIRHQSIGKLSGLVPHSEKSKRPTVRDMAKAVFGRSCAGLISDASASRTLGLPLLQAAEQSWISADLDTEGASHDERIVALNLRLPILLNAPVKDVLKFREDNWALFEKFRSALRRAIDDQIAMSGSASPEVIANQVIERHVLPGLSDIELQLEATKKTLWRKVNANITLGGAAVTVGAMSHASLLLSAAAGAIAASVPQFVGKNVDKKEPIETSEYYFLWKARLEYGH